MTIDQFAIKFFENKTVDASVLNVYYNDYVNSGLPFNTWIKLLKTRA
jgi:hypothetical protein